MTNMNIYTCFNKMKEVYDGCFIQGFFYYQNKKFQPDLVDGKDIFDVIKQAIERDEVRCLNGNFSLYIRINDIGYSIVDRIMSYPLFYSYCDGKTIIADDINAILHITGNKDINKESMMEFMAAGFVLGDHTVFDGIDFIYPGCYMMISESQHEMYRYFDHIHDNNEKETLSDEGVQTLLSQLEKVEKNVFERLINDLQGKQIVLFLSGGYDSRHIAVMLQKNGYQNVICVTFATRDKREEKAAREVAEKLGYKWIYINQVDEFHKIEDTDEYREYIHRSWGGYTYPYIQGAMLKRWINEGKIDRDCVVITGNSGDVIEGRDFALEFERKTIVQRTDIIEAILRRHCYHRGWKYMHNPYLEKKVGSEIPNKKEFTYEEAQDIFERYNWLHRQSNYVVNDIRCYDSYLSVDWRLPLWDNDIVDFWLKVPCEMRRNRRLYLMYVKDEEFTSANGPTLYSRTREKIRSRCPIFLNVFYPLRKIYEYIRDRRFSYYGRVSFTEYVKLVFMSGGYKTNPVTCRLYRFCEEYIMPYEYKKQTHQD